MYHQSPMLDPPPPRPPRLPITLAARLAIWLLPLPLAAAPLITVYLHDRRIISGSLLEDIILIPLVLGMIPGLILKSSLAMLLTAGLYWYLLGFSLLNSLFGRPGFFSRAAMTILIFGTAYLITCGSGWNPN